MRYEIGVSLPLHLMSHLPLARLIARPCIRAFRLALTIFSTAMRFHLGLVQPVASALSICECGVLLDTSDRHLARCPHGGERIATHDAIRDVVFVLPRESDHMMWRERWYALQTRRSVRADLYIMREDQVWWLMFITDPTHDSVTTQMITHLARWAVGVAAATKISKYKGMQVRHHFIPLALEIYGSTVLEFDVFLQDCVRAYRERRQYISSARASAAFVVLLNVVAAETMATYLAGVNAYQEHKFSSSAVDNDLNKRKWRTKLGFFQLTAAKVVDAIEKAAVWALCDAKAPPDYFLNGNYAPVDEHGPALSLPVIGNLPECLNGEFVRVGPNPKLKPVANYHWFDGDGMIHGLRIKDGKVNYVCRYVRTSKLAQEEYWGASKFMKIGDLMGKAGLIWANIFSLRVKMGILDVTDGMATANTAMVYHDGRLLSLSEGDKPYAIRVLEDGDLETIGRLDYEKKLNHNCTAHPKIDPDSGEMFTFGYSTTGPPYVTYRVVSKDGKMGDAVPLTVSGPIMMHDMGLTENYAIFMDCPLYFNPKDMVKKNQCIFAFDDTKPARFGVLPRYAENESQIRWFEVSTCVIFHNANAWEEGSEVILITCRMPSIDLGAIAVFDEVKVKKFVNDLWEYRFNMKTGEVKERKLGEFRSDFPRINEEYVGRKNRFVYTCIFEGSTHISGVAKYDLSLDPELGKDALEVGGNVAGVYWHGEGRYGSEAVFIPKHSGREGDEDDGYLMCFVHDEQRKKSEVVVLDAKTMSSDPVAVVQLPTRVPYGFHALHVTEEQIQKQKQ